MDPRIRIHTKMSWIRNTGQSCGSMYNSLCGYNLESWWPWPVTWTWTRCPAARRRPRTSGPGSGAIAWRPAWPQHSSIAPRCHTSSAWTSGKTVCCTCQAPGQSHKVHTYIRRVQSCGWRLSEYIDPPPPLHPASVSSPRTKGGGVHTRWAVWGEGPEVNILDDASHRIGLLQSNLSTVEAFRLGTARKFGQNIWKKHSPFIGFLKKFFVFCCKILFCLDVREQCVALARPRSKLCRHYYCLANRAKSCE